MLGSAGGLSEFTRTSRREVVRPISISAGKREDTGQLFHERQPMRHRPAENISVKQHDDSYDGAKCH